MSEKQKAWTEEERLQLGELIKERKSAKAIGIIMERSRNAIISASHRFSLTLNPKPLSKQEWSSLNSTPRTRRRGPFVPPREVEQPKPIPEDVPNGPDAGVSFFELNREQCCAVVGKEESGYRLARYCGLPRIGIAYCAYHTKIYYQPPRPRIH